MISKYRSGMLFRPSKSLAFEDNGIKFNPLTIMEPSTNMEAKEREVGGLGIFIVKQMMDKVSYEYKDNKNILTIEKNINLVK